ncbi:S41 family peptidase [candidate division KSB1 bacterium]
MLKSIKRTIILFIVSILIFNASAFAYDDVSHRSPYFYAIEYLRRNDVFQDTKLFKPEIIISKAEFIKYLTILNTRDLKKIQKNVYLPYEDTKNTAWYAPYFYQAIQLGILDEDEKKIYPYKKLTIIEALELLFHSRSIPIPKNYVGYIPYKDLEKNKRVQAMVMRAISLGIVEPESGDHFGLYKKVNRAKAAEMIYQMDLVDLRPPQSSYNDIPELDESLQKIIGTWELINANYLHQEDIDQADLSNSAIRAMVEALNDDYSVFMDEDENQILEDEMDGNFEGIGAYIAINEEGEITIIAPIKNSPAFHAGIKSGDIIKKVDNFNVEGVSLYEVVNHIKGPKGTTVKITVERDGKRLVIEVVRDVIDVKSLEYEVKENGSVMYVKLISFSQNAANEFQEVVEIVTQNPEIKGIILDVRDNPGGLLDASIGILNFILPDSYAAVHIQYNFFNFIQNTSGRGELYDYPMVVLTNKGSASASEIVAGALQDHGVATVIGETTFGKGTVQEVNYFLDSSSLKLTVAKWLTPDMHDIQGNGITPDIEVIQPSESTTDVQLNRAIQELNKMMR